MGQAQLIELNYKEKASDYESFEELYNLLITRFTKGDYLQLNAEWKRAHIAGVAYEILMLMELKQAPPSPACGRR